MPFLKRRYTVKPVCFQKNDFVKLNRRSVPWIDLIMIYLERYISSSESISGRIGMTLIKDIIKKNTNQQFWGVIEYADKPEKVFTG